MGATRGVAQQTVALPEYGTSLSDQQRWTQAIQDDLNQEHFDVLDQAAEEYRQSAARATGGEWLLWNYYSVLTSLGRDDRETQSGIAHLQHWMEQRPQSITARTALLAAYRHYAYGAERNSPLSATYRARIQPVFAILKNTPHTLATCPQWYVEVLSLGIDLHWSASDLEAIFKNGVQLQPGYFYLDRIWARYLYTTGDPIHAEEHVRNVDPGFPGGHSYASEAENQPGIGEVGTPFIPHTKEASSFAKLSADRLSGASGDALYFRIAASLFACDRFFDPAALDWARILRGYHAIETQYVVSRTETNQLAYMAWKYQDAATAAKAFQGIGDHWQPGIWSSASQFNRARKWCQAHVA